MNDISKLFIIGTGRNGSKLAAHCMTANLSSKSTDLHGEIHGGLDPAWFLYCYQRIFDADIIAAKFKESRDAEIAECEKIYIEKNHLIVPILNIIRGRCYSDAKFLYIERNPADIVRSLANRDPYVPSNMNNEYGRGRLRPISGNQYRGEWDSYWNNFDKTCWYVFEVIKMIDLFMPTVDSKNLRVLSYNDMVHHTEKFEEVYDWAGLDYDLNKIKKVLSKPIGTSCKKTYPAPEDWDEDMKEHFDRLQTELKV